ncbi:MAG: ABC transporter substrate-binding protein [Chromatiales bacterium]|jgi:iron complex transport system substrate-binding protein
MSGIVKIFCLLLLSAAIDAAELPPKRVVSINLCTDQLLLLLSDPDQIASVSHLAQDPESSFMAEQASAYPLNHVRLEELLALKPDLVLAGAYTEPRLLRSLERFALRVEQFPLTSSLAGIRADIRRMAALLGQAERGEALIRQMQAKLARIHIDPDPMHRPKALFYQPRGYTSGSQTLQDEALRLAGWRNLAAEAGIRGYAPIDLEALLLAGPDQMFTSGHSVHSYSRAQQQLHHPALRRLLQHRPLREIPFKYWFCAGPMFADAVSLLAAAHER